MNNGGRKYSSYSKPGRQRKHVRRWNFKAKRGVALAEAITALENREGFLEQAEDNFVQAEGFFERAEENFEHRERNFDHPEGNFDRTERGYGWAEGTDGAREGDRFCKALDSKPMVFRSSDRR